VAGGTIVSTGSQKRRSIRLPIAVHRLRWSSINLSAPSCLLFQDRALVTEALDDLPLNTVAPT